MRKAFFQNEEMIGYIDTPHEDIIVSFRKIGDDTEVTEVEVSEKEIEKIKLGEKTLKLEKDMTVKLVDKIDKHPTK